MGTYVIAIVTLLSSLLTAPIHASEHYSNIPTRKGVQLSIWVEKPAAIHSVVVLFSGGKGKLNINEAGIGREGNFLIRSRHHFVERGIAVVVPDVPSDQDNLLYFRNSADYLTDMKYLLYWMQKEFPGVPIYLVGNSRGTISVASIAASLDTQKFTIDGAILSATVTRESNSGKQHVYVIPLKNIRIDTLVLHHKLDACYVSPFADIPNFLDDLVRVKNKKLLAYEGGISEGVPCKGKSYHGFNGIEEQVIADMVDWIKK